MSASTVSVVMPVYNALPYLDVAVQSILDQKLCDFEFVIYDDGSTDGSAERLAYWASLDRRIKLVREEVNLGPAGSSNAAVRNSSGSIVARMDSDDIAYPDRLQVQCAILAEHADVGLVGSLGDVIDANGRPVHGPQPELLARNSIHKPFPHTSMMFRRSLFDAIGGYRDECEYWEDFDFALRAARSTRILVVPRALCSYRQSPVGTRLGPNQARIEAALDLRYRSLDRLAADGSYDDLLNASKDHRPERIDPRVFVSLSLLSLGAGQRPRLARRFLQRARLRMSPRTVIAGLWVLLAQGAPGVANAGIAMLSRIRTARAPALPPGELVEWKPPLP